MPQAGNKNLLSVRHWQNMTQSMATAVCNVTSAVYGRLHLEAVTKRVLPEHTRDALFQLFCDIRANTPKDRVFLVRHAKALQPHTFSGWLAMFAALLYGTAGLALTSIGLLGLMAATAFTSIFFAAIGGIMLASFVGVAATSLAFASLGLVAVSGSVATGAAAGYLTLNFWKSVFRSTGLIRQRVAHANSYTLDTNLPSGRHQYRSQSSQQEHLPTSKHGYAAFAPGENTREATHDKLTTEPAQEPFKKAAEDEDLHGTFSPPQPVSAQSVHQDESSTNSPFASAFQAKPEPTPGLQLKLQGSPDHSLSSQSSSRTTVKPALSQQQATNDQDVNQIFGTGGSSSLGNAPGAGMSLFTDPTPLSGGSPRQTSSSLKQATNDDDLSKRSSTGIAQDKGSGSGLSLFNSGSSGSSSRQPASSQQQATNDQELNEISGVDSSSSKRAIPASKSPAFSPGADGDSKPALNQKQATNDQDLNQITGRDTTESKPSGLPQSSASKDGSTPPAASQQQATIDEDVNKVSGTGSASKKPAAAPSSLSLFTSDTHEDSSADTSGKPKTKQDTDAQPRKKDHKMIGSEDSSLEEGLDLLEDPEKPKDDFQLPRSSQKQAINSGDVDTSADSAGEVKGNAFVPSTGVGLHKSAESAGTKGPKVTDGSSGPSQQLKNDDKADRGQQSQSESDSHAQSEDTDDQDIHTLFGSSGAGTTSQPATGLSLYSSEGPSKQSGTIHQPSSGGGGGGGGGRSERAQESKQAPLTQSHAINDRDVNSLSATGSTGDGEPLRSSAGLGLPSHDGFTGKLAADEQPAYVGGTDRADHLQSEKAPLSQRQATNDRDINALYGSGNIGTATGGAPSASTGLNLYTSGEPAGKPGRHKQPRYGGRDSRGEQEQSLRAPLRQSQATNVQDVNAIFREHSPSQVQDPRNLSSHVSNTAEQQDYTQGQNQALRELHIDGPEPESGGGSSSSFPGESPVFQHAGDDDISNEPGRADSQQGPIISEPSSSPTFASDSGNGSDDQGRFFEHSAAPTGQGAFSKAFSGALPPSSNSQRRNSPGGADLNFHSRFGNRQAQEARRDGGKARQNNDFQDLDEFPGFGLPGRQDIGLQSNFTGPSGPMGSMGPRGHSNRPY